MNSSEEGRNVLDKERRERKKKIIMLPLPRNLFLFFSKC